MIDKWRFTFAVVVVLMLGLMSGCGSPEDPPYDQLTDSSTRIWRFKQAWLRDKPMPLDPCIMDDVMVLHANRTGQYVFGPTSCEGEGAAAPQYFTWDYSADEGGTSGVFTAPGLRAIPGAEIGLKILRLQDDIIKYDNGTQIDGDAFVYVMRPAVQAQFATNPLALIGKRSKTWRYQSAQLDGREVSLAQCQAQGLIIFNVDNTGLFLFDTPGCTPLERPAGGWFKYKVQDQGATIVRGTLFPLGALDESLEVVELNSRVFRFRSKSPAADNITLQPYSFDELLN